MTEETYIKHLSRVATSVTTQHGGSFLICGRQCRIYYPTWAGNIVVYVWLGKLTPDGLKPTSSMVAGPPVSGTVEQVLSTLEVYRQAANVVQQIVDRLGEDAVEVTEEEDIEEDDILTEEDDDEDSLH